MRLVIIEGVQYDADRLPAHVDAKSAVPAEEWFAQNRVDGKPTKTPLQVAQERVAVTPAEPAKPAKPQGKRGTRRSAK